MSFFFFFEVFFWFLCCFYFLLDYFFLKIIFALYFPIFFSFLLTKLEVLQCISGKVGVGNITFWRFGVALREGISFWRSKCAAFTEDNVASLCFSFEKKIMFSLRYLEFFLTTVHVKEKNEIGLHMYKCHLLLFFKWLISVNYL